MVEHIPFPCALYGQITTQEEAECSGSLCLGVDHYGFCCCWVAQSCPTLRNPWSAAHQASLSLTISQSLLKPMSVELVMSSNHLILCHPLFLPPQSFPASGSFSVSWLFPSGGQVLSFSIRPSNEHSGLVSFRMDWLDLLAVPGTLESSEPRSKADFPLR